MRSGRWPRVPRSILSSLFVGLVCAALDAPLGAAAGSREAPALTAPRLIDVVPQWQAKLRGGLSAKRLIGTEVRGKRGKKIGEVVDIVVSARDQLEAIVVETGGFLGMADFRFTVPWSKVVLGPRLEYVAVPLEEDHVPDVDYFEAEKPRIGPRAWRVSELLDDFVILREGTRYGRVEDLLFDRAGRVQAVVVEPEGGVAPYDRYAYPFLGFGYGFDPASRDYTLPYDRNEILNLGPFDYEALEILVRKPRS